MAHEHGHPPLTDGSKPEAPPLGPRAWWKDPAEPAGMWDKKENVDRLLWVFYALCTILVVLDLVIHRHVYHPWERLFGFHAWYGFVACWMLVVIAKQMRLVLMKPEDYYEGDDYPDELRGPSEGEGAVAHGGHDGGSGAHGEGER
ncbi:MAG: hypothetical protein R3253_03960 [Longimicrobiales bacterium]|nr:hypothetical protein [Longimicrobiales bacterium]